MSNLKAYRSGLPGSKAVSAILFAFAMPMICFASDSAGDWPTFRHDWQLTGICPLKGNFSSAPQVAWSVDLGASPSPREHVRVADVDGDGLPEILIKRGDTIICMDRRGKTLWEAKNLPRARITDIRNFAGHGASGILVWTDTGLEMTRWIVSGTTGKATRLYSMSDVFGTEERIGKILRDVPGEQICAWWSGELPGKQFTGTMHADGYIFSFENGVENPNVRFKQTLEGNVYKPKHFFADFDGDGRDEMVVVSHQQAWFFDVENNRQKLYVQWPMIRSYSATLAMLPVQTGAAPSLLSINPHIPGVERVDIVEGQTKVVWRYVAGGKADQYQTQVRIEPGAPDPFVRLADRLYVFAAITNEHGDAKPWLVVLDSVDGAKKYEEPDTKVLCYDDLDGDGTPELLLQTGNAFRIANWSDGKLVDRWRRDAVTPLLTTVPDEGDLGRSLGGNPKIWRVAPDKPQFLLRFADGVFVCSLMAADLERGEQVTVHAALQNIPDPNPPQETVVSDGNAVIVKKANDEVFRYTIAQGVSYLAPPAIVADIGGQRRVLVKDASDNPLSLSSKGDDKKVILSHIFGNWSVCDMDGDGQNEVVAGAADDAGKPWCFFVDADGKVLRKIGLIENSTSLRVGPSGSLGPGKGRWLAIYYERGVGNRNGVVAYDGKTGNQLWLRDDFQTPSASYGPESKVKFVLHIPTAVFDYDGDGTDDLLAASENFYGIMSVSKNSDVTPPVVFSNFIPGHWQAYASPIAVDILGTGKPQVFHQNAFSNAILTTIEEAPIWHWGLSRSATASSWPGIADLDGDGKKEIVQTRVDGLLRAFDATPLDEKCPQCPSYAPLDATNHSAHVRWEKAFQPPISDLAAVDIDGDGKGDVIFGAGDGRLYALGEAGGKPAIKWSLDMGRTVGSPILANFDGNKEPEILVPVEDGRLVCLKR